MTRKSTKKLAVSPTDTGSPKSPTNAVPKDANGFLPNDPRYGREKQWGVWWHPLQEPLLWRHLVCFRKGPKELPLSLGRAAHFKEACNILWGPRNTRKKFVWHPWAERMLDAACAEMDKGDKNFIAVAGCASSGKTDWAAIWAILNFLSAPKSTMVIVTSTTLKDSRKRIWGSIRDYWQAIPGVAPGKLVDSQGLIRFDPGDGSASDKSGITLVAAEKSKDKEALGKLIGFKAPRLILIADELPELGESVVQAAYSNLANNPSFQMIGLGNPASYYDAFGVFAKPKDGWASINAGSEEWETERGICIRFDGEKSPNITAGKTVYPWMITEQFLEQQKEALGENSGAYWRMVRGFWSATGASDGIYSEADIVKFQADQPVIWMTPPTRIAALDPAFTNGGDRSALFFGHYGESKDGLKTLCFDHVEFLNEDVTDKVNPRTFQIVRQFRERCEAFGVLPENAAFDFSGAGKPFGDIVAREWSPKVHRVDFAGKASDLQASVSDPTPACERYANRVTEIWFGAKELIRTGQIKGISTSLAKELCARTYTTSKGATMRLLAEPKPDMKMRIGKSPDEADAALMLVALCREKYGFGADRSIERGQAATKVRPFREQFRRLNMVNFPRTLNRV